MLHMLHDIFEYRVGHVADEKIMLRVAIRQEGSKIVRGFSDHA
ncbi:hypothetical protein SAMN05216258_12312 [Albimonas pacifica]|uniref:Uncharacterized protein n=1 Tax=Albimonas pacifica TaxID=1114924 RepID=A0A1I3Q082_9RHOB|nr:hypothetical protein SAMN05216258_12312 [Albimonas pacifica]